MTKQNKAKRSNDAVRSALTVSHSAQRAPVSDWYAEQSRRLKEFVQQLRDKELHKLPLQSDKPL